MDLFVNDVSFGNVESAKKLFVESRKSFLQLFDNSPVCMSMTTTNFKERMYVRVNQKFLDVFGFDKSEVIGKTPIEVGILDVEESFRVGQIIKTDGRLNNEYVKCTAKDGRFVHTISSLEPMQINGVTYLIAFFVDVTHMIRQQAVIEKSLHQLKEANLELKRRSREIELQKNELNNVKDSLEQKVKLRTQQLETKNMRIKEYAFSNSHLVRGPLARILGLVGLVELEPELMHEVLPLLKENALELDKVIQVMTKILSEEN